MSARGEPNGIQRGVQIEAGVAAQVQCEDIRLLALGRRVDETPRFVAGPECIGQEPLHRRQRQEPGGLVHAVLPLPAAAGVTEGVVADLVGQNEGERRLAAVRVGKPSVQLRARDVDLAAAGGKGLAARPVEDGEVVMEARGFKWGGNSLTSRSKTRWAASGVTTDGRPPRIRSWAAAARRASSSGARSSQENTRSDSSSTAWTSFVPRVSPGSRRANRFRRSRKAGVRAGVCDFNSAAGAAGAVRPMASIRDKAIRRGMCVIHFPSLACTEPFRML